MPTLNFAFALPPRRAAAFMCAAFAAALLAGCAGSSSTPNVPAFSSLPLATDGAEDALPSMGSDLAKLPSRIYIGNYTANNVATYDLQGNQVTPTFSDGVSAPHFIAIGNRRMYIANSNYVQVLSYKLKSGKKTTPAINQNLRFSVGIAVNSKGIVYVGDYLNGTVTTYDGVTGAQKKLTITGLTNPLGIWVDSHNKIYVAQNGVLSIFKRNGTPQSTITAGISSPQAVTVDSKGKIYVSNCAGSGGYISTYLANGTQTTPTITGLNCPQQVVVDARGTIYVTDYGTGMMTTYSAKGKKQPLTINVGNPTFGLAIH